MQKPTNQQTPEALRAQARILRHKAQWHISRCDTTGSFKAAERYTQEAEALEDQANRTETGR